MTSPRFAFGVRGVPTRAKRPGRPSEYRDLEAVRIARVIEVGAAQRARADGRARVSRA